MALSKSSGSIQDSSHQFQRPGNGTVGGSQVLSNGIAASNTSSILFATDPTIKYFDLNGVQDEMQRATDTSTAPSLSNTTNKIAFSYTPTSNVKIYQFLQGLSTTSGFVGKIRCTIQADSAGSPSGTPLVTAYDELGRATDVESGIASDNGFTGFHIYLNNGNAALTDYVAGSTQDPYSLTAGTTYWIVLQLVTSGGSQSGTMTLKGRATTGTSRVKTYNGSSWSTYSSWEPQYGIITSGWKWSRTIVGSYGGITVQLSNYPYIAHGGMPDVSAYMSGSSGTRTSRDILPYTAAADAATIKGPYLVTEASGVSFGVIQDMIERLDYNSVYIDDYTYHDGTYWQKKELMLYIDNVPALLIDRSGGTYSIIRYLSHTVSNLSQGIHSIKIGLRYYKFTGITGGMGGGVPFAENNSLPDQFRFEGFEIRNRVNLDNLAIYGYSAAWNGTTDSNGNVVARLSPPVGYTIVTYIGGYPASLPTSSGIICATSASGIVIQNGAATTAYSLRITALISPTRSGAL